MQTGYPHGRPGYVVDHIVPLACGGADAPSNMQWQSVADGKEKDRIERVGCNSAVRSGAAAVTPSARPSSLSPSTAAVVSPPPIAAGQTAISSQAPVTSTCGRPTIGTLDWGRMSADEQRAVCVPESLEQPCPRPPTVGTLDWRTMSSDLKLAACHKEQQRTRPQP
jgi:hypothetical protein